MEHKKRRKGGEKRVEVEVEPNDQTQEMKSLLTVMVGEQPRQRLFSPVSGPVSPFSGPEVAAAGEVLAPR